MTGSLAWRRDWPEATPGSRSTGAHVWLGRSVDVPGAAPPFEPTAEDLAEALRRPEALRAGFLGRRLLLRRFVAALTGSPAPVVMSDAGRPRLAAPLQHLSVSTASRDDWVALALADAPVGVDLEPVGAGHEPAWNVLSAAEQADLRQRSEKDRWAAFLTLWTAKEAYLKAIGLGLSREPRTIDVTVRGSSLQIRDDGRPAATATAQRLSVEGPAGCLVAACVTLRPRR